MRAVSPFTVSIMEKEKALLSNLVKAVGHRIIPLTDLIFTPYFCSLFEDSPRH